MDRKEEARRLLAANTLTWEAISELMFRYDDAIKKLSEEALYGPMCLFNPELPGELEEWSASSVKRFVESSGFLEIVREEIKERESM